MVYFSSREKLKRATIWKTERLFTMTATKVTEIVDISELKALGRHNHENVMAAVAISMNMDVPA